MVDQLKLLTYPPGSNQPFNANILPVYSRGRSEFGHGVSLNSGEDAQFGNVPLSLLTEFHLVALISSELVCESDLSKNGEAMAAVGEKERWIVPVFDSQHCQLLHVAVGAANYHPRQQTGR